ncbi:MAG TPA: hypothetical protein VHT28_19140 [Silvibacterium sp.]|nr:hypothetical protein [Silvibacterium sp.]
MRTTWAVADDVYEAVKDLAESNSISMGEAATLLMRRGLTRPLPTRIVNGLHIPVLPPGGKKITLEMVKKIDSEQDMEKVLPYMRGRKR